MQKARKYWEFYFWLPLIFLVAVGFFIVSCSKEDEEPKAPKITTVHKAKIDKTSAPTEKPIKTNNPVEKPDKIEKPVDHDALKLPEKATDFTGTIHLSFTNDTLSNLTPCG